MREGVNHVFNDGLGLLHMACLSQNFAAVECLVTAGVDTNIRDTQGQPTSLGSCAVFIPNILVIFTHAVCDGERLLYVSGCLAVSLYFAIASLKPTVRMIVIALKLQISFCEDL